MEGLGERRWALSCANSVSAWYRLIDALARSAGADGFNFRFHSPANCQKPPVRIWRTERNGLFLNRGKGGSAYFVAKAEFRNEPKLHLELTMIIVILPKTLDDRTASVHLGG
uniref:Uncharacterized protein n=1 Tax=Anopheles coluzzii TaxID=1518534 RepID=A0A8W7P5Q6_ANOCL